MVDDCTWLLLVHAFIGYNIPCQPNIPDGNETPFQITVPFLYRHPDLTTTNIILLINLYSKLYENNTYGISTCESHVNSHVKLERVHYMWFWRIWVTYVIHRRVTCGTYVRHTESYDGLCLETFFKLLGVQDLFAFIQHCLSATQHYYFFKIHKVA